MKIQDILTKTRTISFEFFPPREATGINAVLNKIESLQSYSPDFISVTYGAGGSTRKFSEELTTKAQIQYDVEVMAHLTCVGHTVKELDGILERLEGSTIENIIALRGDLPNNQQINLTADSGFEHASDLISHINRIYSFGIGAACYPEGHPEAVSFDHDIHYAKLKVENGADFLITQLFYDNDDFFRFVDKARAIGINVPIIPGVLPVLSSNQIRKFTRLCGARIPLDLEMQLAKYENDNDGARAMGVEYATRQVQGLWDSGVSGIHFYVLNRSYSVSKILDNLRLERSLP
ncbi:MAG: methylenetetrahydrofolate reductase [NAD(P)H] [Anaerolineaceae bacterium]|nr:methylenetetrahydrofolate reductase [NAD(P)H] [Anaerolineaceae bacterium]